MQVLLIAHTALAEDYETDGKIVQQTPYTLHATRLGDAYTSDADELAEFSGRACYQSWQRPNPATATNEGYLANILKQQHFSVLEHASATFYVTGVSRALTHELIRHRHLSYSQLSQRFVDESGREPVVPPAIAGDRVAEGFLKNACAYAEEYYGHLVGLLTEKGLPRKQAREAARAVLPNAQPTAIVVTGNMRAWREVIARRIDPAADAEIQIFAGHVLRHLKTIAPNTFQDFEEVH